MSTTTTRWVSKAPQMRHVLAFDWIRGFGIFGVMLGHSFPQETLSFAGIVDIFFVISGYLITTLLLQEHRKYNKIDLRKFYARRSLRLMPLLYFFLTVLGIVALVAYAFDAIDPLYPMKTLVVESVTSAFYVHNFFFPDLSGPWLAHLWTLSVEEQFYLIVGVFMVVSLRRGRVKQVTWILLFLVAAIQLSRGFGIVGPTPLTKQLAMAVWLQRPDSLMIGMLGAILNAHIPDPISPKLSRLMRIGGWVGAVTIFATAWASSAPARYVGIKIPFWPGDANYTTHSQKVLEKMFEQPGWFLSYPRTYWIQWGFSATNWAFFLVCLPTFRVPEWSANKIMGWKPLVKIGALFSYGLYIWHYPCQYFLRMALGTTHTRCHGVVNLTTCRQGDHYKLDGINPVWQAVLDCTIPFLFAVPTYYFIERKALTIKDKFQVDKAAAEAAQARHA